MRAARLRAPLRPASLIPTEQVVAQQVRDECQERGDEQIRQDQSVERQVECIETEVDTELGIGHPEAAAVEEQLNLLPVALSHETGQYADEGRHPDADETQPRHHRGAVARDRIVGSRRRHEHRPSSVGQRQRGEHDRAEQDRDDEEDHQAGDDLRREHRPVAELAEPQPVDIGVDEPWSQQQQHHDGQRDRDQKPASLRQLRHSRRGPHTHSTTPLSEIPRRSTGSITQP